MSAHGRIARGAGLLATLLCAAAAGARAQTLSITSSGSTVTVPSPTQAQYDAAAPGNVTGASTSLTFQAACPGGSSGCTLKIGYSGAQQVGVQWQITSLTKAGTNDQCTLAVALGTWTALTTTPATVATATRNSTCNGTLAFRVSGLSYTTYLSPNTYTQQVSLAFTQP